MGKVIEPEVTKGRDEGYESNEGSVALLAAEAANKALESTTSSTIEAPQPFRDDPLILERILHQTLAGEDRLGSLEPTDRCESPSSLQVLAPIGFERQTARQGEAVSGQMPEIRRGSWCIC